MLDVKYRDLAGPPSSPPINFIRLNIINEMAIRPNEQNKVTENANEPGTTINFVPLYA
jgi:hypothetical protein